MSLYQIIFTSSSGVETANPFVNAFYYDVDDVLPSSSVAASLAAEFDANVLQGANAWENVVSSSMNGDVITVTSPFNPSVLGIFATLAAGSQSGDVMPRFVAWSFKADRKRADIRNGFKRFGRISETDTAGVNPSVAMAPILNAFAAKLSASFQVSDGVSFYNAVPVIVKRIKYVTPSGNDAYRLPNSPAEYQYFIADNWRFTGITTQNSRKG